MLEPLEWTVGWCRGPEEIPAEFVPACVPGAVQRDWAAAHGWPDYTYADNFLAYGWTENVYWLYQTSLDFPPLTTDQRLIFSCRGIDYQFEVRLDGHIIHAQEGMFTPFTLDLTEQAVPGSRLEVLVFPVPKSRPSPADRAQADQSCKPAVSYGWDWHPRLIPLGIWDEARLEVKPRVYLQSAETRYALSDDLLSAELTLSVQLSEAGPRSLRWQLRDEAGATVCEASADVLRSNTVTLRTHLDGPVLWWPNGQGEPTLYTSVVELRGEDDAIVETHEQKVGFRRVRLVMAPGAWEEPAEFPKTRSNPPITLEVNGRQIFGKGSNWVNPEIFPGVITEDTYRPLLQMARDAHFNLLRVWGGGIVNKESFFDQCDALGLLIWQEFPLACNNYEGTPAYLATLDTESRSIIRRLRGHACLALWCGGNELFNGWSGMTDQSAALRLLNRNCYDLDPQTPFLMTAPLMGMAHGNYLFRYEDGREVFQVLPQSEATAYTEFGCPGPSPAEYLATFIPADELFPPRPGTAWETHHGFGAWQGDTWLQLQTIESYFGPAPDLETLVARGEWLQCEGYKCLFEEARRQKPACAMSLNWCYNEPWPSAANNSLINWPARPKPAYYAAAAACRPTLASARIPKFAWTEGELFCPELWLLHDGPEPLPAGRINVFLQVGEQEIFLLAWDFSALESNDNLAGPILRVRLPQAEAEEMSLVLRVPGQTSWKSVYRLQYHPKRQLAPTGTATLNV